MNVKGIMTGRALFLAGSVPSAYTIQRPTEDRFLMGRHELENKMAVLMAGRAGFNWT
jgi:ATP-dependent Zn protease